MLDAEETNTSSEESDSVKICNLSIINKHVYHFKTADKCARME